MTDAGGTLFVTGMLRSGTTLLERLFAAQQAISMLSQPFPLVLLEAKRAFFRSIGADGEAIPFGHLFGESRYDASSLQSFLATWRLTPSDAAALFETMRTYSGQGTRFTDDEIARAADAAGEALGIAGIVAALDRVLARKKDASWFGSKEVVCEELVAALLDRGLRCVIILRDPRDVVASLNSGAGGAYGGDIRPTLFNVRAWRKSVAFAIECESHPHFARCRYEDLVRDPANVMRTIGSRLGIDVDSDILAPRDDSGVPWRGNSSYASRDGVSSASVGAYREALPPDAARFIEAATLPELHFLGYETTMTIDEAKEVVAAFREPWETRAFPADDLPTAANLTNEVERLARVTSGGDARPWFLSERVRDRLRDTVTRP